MKTDNQKCLVEYKVLKLSDSGKTALLGCRVGRNIGLTFGWAAATPEDKVGDTFKMEMHSHTEQAKDKEGNPVFYTSGEPVLRFVWE